MLAGGSRLTPSRQGFPLGSSEFLTRTSSTLTQLSRLTKQPSRTRVGAGSAQAPVATNGAVASAAPLLHVVRRVAARTLPAWLAAARSLNSARVSPLLVAALVVYSVGVTVWAATSRTATAAATSSASGSSEATALDPVVQAASTATPAAEAGRGAAVQQAAKSLQQAAAAKDDGRVACRVCNGRGEVFYNNHMESDGGASICPCCLVRPGARFRLRGVSRNLILAPCVCAHHASFCLAGQGQGEEGHEG